MVDGKTLFLIRHAKSSWANVGGSDFDRPLNERGKRDAPRMGERLAERGVRPDLVLSSPAVRAATTAHEICAQIGLEVDKIIFDEQLYLASPQTIITKLRSIDAEVNIVMVFAHNPGITELANSLCGANIANVPTAGVVEVGVKIPSWRELRAGCGELVSFDYPKRQGK